MAFSSACCIILIYVIQCWAQKPKVPVALHLPDYRQPDDVDEYAMLAPKNDTIHCHRECVEGDHRICYYDFVLENYAVLSGACGNCLQNNDDCYLPQCVSTDGYERGILTANRKIPGPGIHVCYGDWIIVDIRNTMLARSISIHWHGIHQVNRGYMDGVPYINQCPILEDTAFRYIFRADHTGTNYWHAHSALHKLNGLQGNFIVRSPKDKDPVSELYDYDQPNHNFFIMDWNHAEAENRLPGLIRREPTQEPTYYLINGRGKYTMENGTLSSTPYEMFTVQQGKRYRFRVISAICTQCAARFQIEGHKLLIIATDGVPVKPRLVDSLQIYSGERYDFVLHASKKVRKYWIQVRGMGLCFNKDICQVAILHYEGAEEEEPSSPRPSLQNFRFDGVIMNPPNATCGPGDNGICVNQLESLVKVPRELIHPTKYKSYGFEFGFFHPTPEELFYSGKYRRYLQVTSNISLIPFVNGIQQDFPSSPLLTQYEDIPKHELCLIGIDGLPTCPEDSSNTTGCHCVPVVRVKFKEVVQFILLDKSDAGGLEHPFHLHGQNFAVISSGYLPQKLMNERDIDELLRSGELPVPKDPVMKDTFPVPASGYTVIRFITRNPGFWFFHCHFLFHHAAGMGTIIQVGEPSQFPKIPKGFPRCGDYKPPIFLKYKKRNRPFYRREKFRDGSI